ncbi:hypothetical protein Anas_09729, partial [Armadillidium nasatum]
MNDQNSLKENLKGIPNSANKNLPGLQDILNENLPENSNNYGPGNEISLSQGSNSVSGESANSHQTLDQESMRVRDEIIHYLPELIKEGVRNAERILDLQKDKIAIVLESIPIKPFHNELRTKYCLNKKRKIVVTPRMTCDPNHPYRTITGMCNNLINPQLGASNTPFARFLTPDYGDGFNSLRGEGGQSNLPSPRLVSASLSTLSTLQNPSKDIHLTQMFKAWGQTIDHDCTFAPESDGKALEIIHGCCEDGRLANVVNTDECRPIIATGDPFYRQFGIECLRFTRSLPAAASNFGIHTHTH